MCELHMAFCRLIGGDGKENHTLLWYTRLHTDMEVCKMSQTIDKYWRSFCQSKGMPAGTAYSAFAFGDSAEMADRLGQLVLSGKKTGTSGAYDHYAEEPLPEKGDYQIVLNSQGEPLCVIQNTDVDILPFREITARHAEKEGEGDLSLTYWRNTHWHFFSKYHTLELEKEFTEDDLVVFETFVVVYPTTV